MADGAPNGCPPFLAEFHADIKPQRWKRAFESAYQHFDARVDALDRRLPPDFDDDIPEHANHYDELFSQLPLDPYASKNPAEFFAVASEAFFVLPAPLSEDYPEVYDLLRLYYRQDPLTRDIFQQPAKE
jgi:Mlc titration factor MtfA (ptsG expression regulator)